MQIELKIKRILPILAGLFFLWSFFIISKFLVTEAENKNHLYIPADNTFSMTVSGKTFFKTAVYDIILNNADREFFSYLKNFSDNNQPSRKQMKDLGIDYLSDVIVFGQQIDNQPVIGFIFNLENEANFKKNMPALLGKQQYFASNTDVGVILNYAPNNEGKNAVNKNLRQAAVTILKNGTEHPSTLHHLSSRSLFSITTSQKDAQSYLGKGKLEGNIEGNLIHFDGNFNLNRPVSTSEWSLKQDGFYISTKTASKELQDTLQYYLQKNGFVLPNLEKLSLNYRGTVFGNGGVIPQMDLLLEFATSIDILQLVNPEKWRKLGCAIDAQGNNLFLLSIGESTFQMQILEEKYLFIGLKKSNLEHRKNQEILVIKGDLKNITKIEGGGFLTVGLNFYPPFKAGKQFAEAVETCDVELKQHNGKVILNGKIDFVEGKTALTELLKVFFTVKG